MADKGMPRFDYDVCVACAICMHACPVGCIEMTKTGVDKLKTVFPALVKPDACISCGQCEKQCPMGAVTLQA